MRNHIFRTVLLSVLLLTALAGACFAQGAVNQVSAPPPDNYVQQLFYDGSNNLIYACRAVAYQPLTTFYKSSATLTNIVVTTNGVSSGVITFSSTSYLWVGAQITVAGSATAALNGTYKVTAVSGSTATITTVGVSDATYTDATLTVSTRAPLLNAAVWAIQALTYDGSNNLTGTYWTGTPSPTVPMLACSARASY